MRWTPLDALRNRFDANLAALARRDSRLAARVEAVRPSGDHFVAVAGDTLHLGRREVGGGGDITPLPTTVSAASAQRIVAQLRRSNAAESSVVVSGLDQGWLWDALYRTDETVATAPGYRTPIYLLAGSPERLRVAMHLHDWRRLLADDRCRVFAGPDAVAALERHLLEHPEINWPTINVTVEPALWLAGETLDALLARASARASHATAALREQIDRAYQGVQPRHFAERIRGGQALRVLGITSRFTTFLQHSMRDWLAAFESAGHETRLLIEQSDHEKLHPLAYLREIADFKPDLLLLIDHFRGEIPHMPPHMPAVMWVQDRLPGIFNAAAGAAQGPMDYVIGYGRRDAVTDFGYPAARYMESPVGVNERRFAEASVNPRYACEVAFVSHASETPESILRGELDRYNAPPLKLLLNEVYDRLAAVYARGESLTQELALLRLIEQAITVTGVKIDDVRPLADLVSNRLNNAFFRHQALQWLADAGVDLHLWGRGWEKHPTLARFARGAADNQRQLADIYRSAAINLQVTPFGSAHQRLFEGLCAGGFFLLRRVTGDDVEPMYVELYDFLRRKHIADDEDLRARADDRARALMHHVEGLTGEHPLAVRHDFVDALRATAAGGFLRASSTIWPKQFPAVAFATREELVSKVGHYLRHPQERASLVESMQRVVLQQVTYRGISERMLSFIANELARASLVATVHVSKKPSAAHAAAQAEAAA